MKEAYPLHWPAGYQRTAVHRRRPSQFKQSMDRAQKFLREEIKRLGGRDLIVSTNLPLRLDGLLYSDWMKRKIDDPGVAIYFKYKGKDISMCCDQYAAVWENIYALGKGIEALRGMDRWGVSDFLERAFTGFTALPASSAIVQRDIWDVLGLSSKPGTVVELAEAYKSQAKKTHPDAGGTKEAFQELQDAYQKALKFYN